MSSWLHKLRATELHRLAVLLGTPCSGTKSVKIEGIENVLKKHTFSAGSLRKSDVLQQNQKLRLLSIDMGVKNLAFAYFTATEAASTESSTTKKPARGQRVPQLKLEAWQKFDISASTEKDDSRSLEESPSNGSDDAHAYHPSIYAGRAYRFVQSILRYEPTHIIIERQRFRSGGGPAVQEWSIRVGVFEAMLWAVLCTLTEQNATNSQKDDKLAWHVESVLPTRVNQFWFGEHAATTKLTSDALQGGSSGNDTDGTSGSERAAKLSGKEMKKAKIKLVVSLLDELDGVRPSGRCRPFEIGDSEPIQNQVRAFQQAYGPAKRSDANKKSSSKKSSSTLNSNEALPASKISKLDDLADCLLQGVAWWNWRNNQIKAVEQGKEAFDL